MIKKSILISLTAISIGLYFSCSNSSNGSGGGTPTPTSSASDSIINLSIDGQTSIKYYAPVVTATKQTDGIYVLHTIGTPTPRTTANGALTINIKSFTTTGATYQFKDDKLLLLLTTPQLPIGGATNCKNNPEGSLTITSVIEEKDKTVKGSYPGYISGNFTATLCESADGKKHTITGNFEKLKIIFIDPSILGETAPGTNKDILISVDGGTEKKYTNVLSNVTYAKEVGLSFSIITSSDPTKYDNLMSISASIPKSPTSSIKGTHLITKEIDADVKHVVGEYRMDGKGNYESYECGTVEGNVTITDESRGTGTTPGFSIGYISGTYTFKVCDGDGNSATIKGSFTKLSTVFAGE